MQLVIRKSGHRSYAKTNGPFRFVHLCSSPLQAALQAMDRPGRALINTLIGAVVKIILIVILASQPEYGIYGAIIAIIVNSVLVTLLHGYSVVSLISLSLRITDTIKTLCAMIIMGAGVRYVYISIPIAEAQWIQFLFASAIGMALYFGLSLLAGLISLRDLDRLPFIKRWL